MRATSPFRVTIERFGVWNGFVGCLGALVCLCAGAWLCVSRTEVFSWTFVLLALATSVSLFCLITSVRRVPIGLRWDSQRWFCSHGVNADLESGPWRARVLLDLGSFMLLRLDADDPAMPLRHVCLPLQRHGLRAHWHAVRCAIHARDVHPIQAHTPQLADLN